jgi:hypothetical protein
MGSDEASPVFGAVSKDSVAKVYLLEWRTSWSGNKRSSTLPFSNLITFRAYSSRSGSALIFCAGFSVRPRVAASTALCKMDSLAGRRV